METTLSSSRYYDMMRTERELSAEESVELWGFVDQIREMIDKHDDMPAALALAESHGLQICTRPVEHILAVQKTPGVPLGRLILLNPSF